MAEKKEEEKEVWPMMNMDSSVNITDPGLGYLGLGYTCQTCRGEGPGIDCRSLSTLPPVVVETVSRKHDGRNQQHSPPRVFYPLTHGPRLQFAMHKDVNLSTDGISPAFFLGRFLLLDNRPRET
jgi:hypothetical protein